MRIMSNSLENWCVYRDEKNDIRNKKEDSHSSRLLSVEKENQKALCSAVKY